MEQLTLGQRIKTARLSEGLTLTELAEKAELTPGYLSNLEIGKRKPSVGLLLKLAEVLNEPNLANLTSDNITKPKSVTVGQRIKIARKLTGMTLAQLSTISGFSSPYLSLIETDKRIKPSLEVLKAIADALGNVSFQELLMLAGYSELLPDDAYEQTPRFIDLSDICKARTLQLSDNEIQYNGHPLSTEEVSRVLQVLDAIFPEYRERC